MLDSKKERHLLSQFFDRSHLPWVEKTGKIMKNLEEQVINVQALVSSELCSPYSCFAKPSNTRELRLVVDLKKVNAKIGRPYNRIITVADAWHKVPKGMMYFATVDLSATYWLILAVKEFQDILTFMEPSGSGVECFWWTCLPMGLSVSSDNFNDLVERAMKEEAGLTNYAKIMDDILCGG